MGGMGLPPLLLAVDAVTVRVPDLDQGLRFYRDQLGHELLWRNEEVGQAGLRLPESNAELVLSTRQEYAPNWLVASVEQAVEAVVAAGGGGGGGARPPSAWWVGGGGRT